MTHNYNLRKLPHINYFPDTNENENINDNDNDNDIDIENENIEATCVKKMIRNIEKEKLPINEEDYKTKFKLLFDNHEIYINNPYFSHHQLYNNFIKILYLFLHFQQLYYRETIYNTFMDKIEQILRLPKAKHYWATVIKYRQKMIKIRKNHFTLLNN
jgi:hypothetical protein